MLWDKKDNLMLEAFTADILTTDGTYCIYYPENTEATFSALGLSVPQEGAYGYYFPNKGGAEAYTDFNIKIRQNFGKQFTFITYFSIDSEGIFYAYSYTPKNDYNNKPGYYYGNLVLTTKNTPTEGKHTNANDPYAGSTVHRVKIGQMYMIASTINWNSNDHYFDVEHKLYNCSTKGKESEGGLSAYHVNDPMTVSNEIPGLYLYCENGTEVTFYGLRAYSCSLTNDEILECLNASIYFNKSPSQLRAKKFNEYSKYDGNLTIENDENTHEYRNTTFRSDGTVCCSGQLIEGSTNQICKNGDIKCQEFIEY